MNRKNRLTYLHGGYVVLGIALAFTIIASVYADSNIPYGVRSIGIITSSRSNASAYPPGSTEAEAGNVTELSLNAISSTKTWQGYFGNISGTITLEDSNGHVFYNWTALEPKGEIFASLNDTVDWSVIRCFEWVGAGQSFTEQDVEGWYGIGDDQSDGIAETFNYTLDRNFFVGSRNITQVSTDDFSATCHATNTYTDGSEQVDDDFENVLLTDGAVLVFTTIIENNDFDNVTDKVGFDGLQHDFQLLVAEDGHDGFEDTTTTYYFWAEIE